MDPETMKLLAIGMTTGLGLMGPALAIGLARNPEARGPIGTNMILAIAFAEAIGIYALIIAIILAIVV